MEKNEALQHALGYAAGREDATRDENETITIPTVDPPEGTGVWPGIGWLRFADAYAAGWDDFNHGRRCSMVCCRSAWETWQASGGRTIFSDELALAAA